MKVIYRLSTFYRRNHGENGSLRLAKTQSLLGLLTLFQSVNVIHLVGMVEAHFDTLLVR